MNEKPLVEIVCDGNGRIGLGHIRRSTALAVSLQKDNISTRLVGLSEEARRLLPPVDSYKDKADIIVFDVAIGIDDVIEKAKENAQLTVALDWFGTAVPDINIAVYPHTEVKALKEKYIGFEYIILRDEIIMQQPVSFKGETGKVLVCLGGGDLLEQGFDAAMLLHKKGFDVTLVQGALAKNIPGNYGFTVVSNPSNFPALLGGCDWAVTNGGGCLFEALYFDKPVYVLPQTEWEMRIAVFAKEQQAILGIGTKGLETFSAEEIPYFFRKKIKLVDGHGAERIKRIIKNLL
jgi:spore coat polysaccharide biosynthesis predicted glycosyltransferase SpsG